mgnify:CR=1 FL=1
MASGVKGFDSSISHSFVSGGDAMLEFKKTAECSLNQEGINQVKQLSTDMMLGNVVERIVRIGSHDYNLKREGNKVVVYRMKMTLEQNDRNVHGMNRRK